MKVSEDQKKKIAEWVAEGLSLSQIQQRIADELGLTLTYMDTRFLVDDLGLALAEQKPPPPPAPQPAAEAAAPAEGVSVSLDRVVQPGAVASGSVTFSDGKRSAWALDQAGRLILEAAMKGYRPSQEDLEAFQQELSRALERAGF
jgi:hypothetical protein